MGQYDILKTVIAGGCKLLLIACGFLTATGAAAQAKPLPPSILLQATAQPICQDRPAFGIGNYTPSLFGQDLNCWMRKVRLNKISVTPLAYGVDYVPRQNSIGQRDQLGFTSEDWRDLPDSEVLAVFLYPKNLNTMVELLNDGLIGAFVPMHLLGDFVTTGEQRLSPAFGIAYPACADFSPEKGGTPACTAAYQEIRTRIVKAGFGQKIAHGNLSYDWADLGLAIGRSSYFKGFARARWLGFERGTVYSDEDGSRLVEVAKAGYAPASILLARLGNTCSGTSYVYGPMRRYGLDLKTVTDWAVAAGDGEAALSFGNFLRNGTCGALADRKASFDYLYKSAELGHAPALKELATLYNNDESFGRDPRTLITAFQGNPDADAGAIATLTQAAARFDKMVAREGLITDNPAIAPNVATVRAVMLRELRSAYEGFDGGLQNELSQFSGNRYNWDESKGRLEVFQNGNSGMSAYATQQFNVSSTSCTPIVGRQNVFSCRTTLSIFMDAGLGNLKIADNLITPSRTVTEEVVFEGGRWRSPALRQRMIAGLKAPPANKTQGTQGQSALCRSLNAGVAAVGGGSTSTALAPSTWGC